MDIVVAQPASPFLSAVHFIFGAALACFASWDKSKQVAPVCPRVDLTDIQAKLDELSGSIQVTKSRQLNVCQGGS